MCPQTCTALSSELLTLIRRRLPFDIRPHVVSGTKCLHLHACPVWFVVLDCSTMTKRPNTYVYVCGVWRAASGARRLRLCTAPAPPRGMLPAANDAEGRAVLACAGPLTPSSAEHGISGNPAVPSTRPRSASPSRQANDEYDNGAQCIDTEAQTFTAIHAAFIGEGWSESRVGIAGDAVRGGERIERLNVQSETKKHASQLPGELKALSVPAGTRCPVLARIEETDSQRDERTALQFRISLLVCVTICGPERQYLSLSGPALREQLEGSFNPPTAAGAKMGGLDVCLLSSLA